MFCKERFVIVIDRVTIFLGLANFAVKTVQLFGSMQVASSSYPSSLPLAHYHNPYLSQRTGTLKIKNLFRIY